MLILQFPSFRWVVIVLGWATLWLFLLAWLESRLNVRNYVGKDGLSTIFGVEFAAVLFLSSWFKKLLFPAVVFDFGKSATVGQKIAYARNTIFVIIGLGLMVGIVASVVGNWISSAKPP